MDQSSWWPTGRSRVALIAAPVVAVTAVLLLALGFGRPAADAVPVALCVGGIVLTVGAAIRGVRRGRDAGLSQVERTTSLRQVRGREPHRPQDRPRLRVVADSYGRSCVDSILFSAGLVLITGGLLAISTSTFLRAIAGGGLLLVVGALVVTTLDLRRARRFLTAR